MSGFFSHSSSRRGYPDPRQGGGRYRRKGLFGNLGSFGSFSSSRRRHGGYPQGNTGGSMTCPKCGASIPGGSKFCLSCGEKVTANAAFCPNCGKPLPPGAKFCMECGTPIK